MDAALLKAVGQIAGIGGLSLGVFLLLFREIIRKKIFPMLPPPDAYRLLRLITAAVWSIALVGIAAWVYTSQAASKAVSANHGIAIGGDVADGSKIENTTNVENGN